MAQPSAESVSTLAKGSWTEQISNRSARPLMAFLVVFLLGWGWYLDIKSAAPFETSKSLCRVAPGCFSKFAPRPWWLGKYISEEFKAYSLPASWSPANELEALSSIRQHVSEHASLYELAGESVPSPKESDGRDLLRAKREHSDWFLTPSLAETAEKRLLESTLQNEQFTRFLTVNRHWYGLPRTLDYSTEGKAAESVKRYLNELSPLRSNAHYHVCAAQISELPTALDAGTGAFLTLVRRYRPELLFPAQPRTSDGTFFSSVMFEEFAKLRKELASPALHALQDVIAGESAGLAGMSLEIARWISEGSPAESRAKLRRWMKMQRLLASHGTFPAAALVSVDIDDDDQADQLLWVVYLLVDHDSRRFISYETQAELPFESPLKLRRRRDLLKEQMDQACRDRAVFDGNPLPCLGTWALGDIWRSDYREKHGADVGFVWEPLNFSSIKEIETDKEIVDADPLERELKILSYFEELGK